MCPRSIGSITPVTTPQISTANPSGQGNTTENSNNSSISVLLPCPDSSRTRGKKLKAIPKKRRRSSGKNKLTLTQDERDGKL